ncbi:MAG: peptide-methionine (S)-S-oxide reductase MsrA [Vicinamibacteria bacterium]
MPRATHLRRSLLPLIAVVGLAAASLAQGAQPKPEAGPRGGLAKATFAGGCFWCMVKPFVELPGVVQVVSGYSGGQKRNPTYEEVSAGITGHAESVQVIYDPAKVTYARLLDVYWHNIDPTSAEGQFCDRGHQYRSAIFVQDEAERRLAEESKVAQQAEVAKTVNRPIVTEIVPFTEFWPAEEYHQYFYQKNPVRYESYRLGCGRDRRLQEIWGAKAGH